MGTVRFIIAVGVTFLGAARSWGQAPELALSMIAPRELEAYRQAANCDSKCAALVSALRAHEQSIRAISWKQTAYMPPCSARNRPSWTQIDATERYVDERGVWMRDMTRATNGGPQKQYALSYSRTVDVCAGPFRLAWDADTNEGMIAAPDDWFIVGCNIWRALGHAADIDHPATPRALSEILGSAKALTYLPPSRDEPWPGVHADTALTEHWWHAEVRLDPVHQFAPRLIRMIRGQDELITEVVVVAEFQRVGNVDLPAIVVQCSYGVPPDGVKDIVPDKKADIEKARLLSGLPVRARSPMVADWIERLAAKARGNDSAPYAFPNGAGQAHDELVTPQVCVLESAELNKFIAVSELCERVPDDSKIHNDPAGGMITGADGKRLLSILAKRCVAPIPGNQATSKE